MVTMAAMVWRIRLRLDYDTVVKTFAQAAIGCNRLIRRRCDAYRRSRSDSVFFFMLAFNPVFVSDRQMPVCY